MQLSFHPNICRKVMIFFCQLFFYQGGNVLLRFYSFLCFSFAVENFGCYLLTKQGASMRATSLSSARTFCCAK
ncbi:hypothetical protein QVD17_15504 [Tagetes erecta]|uniref:Uncharacterized protein n=1 Tax=Tagetes erecta TaxID=13708 RepID=A0AAD8KPC1_TARER|nr:hypothetical protein QVD17_15504 [Tagetes erecta]